MYKFSHLSKYSWDGREKKRPSEPQPIGNQSDPRLRQQPKMMERVQRILEIANSTEGPLKTADEIEELLLEEMCRLGNETMTEWATHAEKRVGDKLKEQDPTVLK